MLATLAQQRLAAVDIESVQIANSLCWNLWQCDNTGEEPGAWRCARGFRALSSQIAPRLELPNSDHKLAHCTIQGSVGSRRES